MDKKTAIAITVSVVVIGVLLGGGLMGGLFTSSNSTQDSTSTMQQQSDQVQISDSVAGTGDVAVPGKEVTVHYTGVLAATGQTFDSSRTKGVPFTFTLGAGQVIRGWDIGVEGMKVGGKRVLVIPPDFAYGPNDYGPIPGNSTLVFEVELLSVK